MLPSCINVYRPHYCYPSMELKEIKNIFRLQTIQLFSICYSLLHSPLSTNRIPFIRLIGFITKVCKETKRKPVWRLAPPLLLYNSNKVNLRQAPQPTRLSIVSKKGLFWGTPQLSGFVCTYHPAALGSSPKLTIYTFIINSQICALFVM